ncbi:MAG: hypothetical protein ABIJ45_07155 [Candidatus Zixiibacteriota bacterium]
MKIVKSFIHLLALVICSLLFSCSSSYLVHQSDNSSINVPKTNMSRYSFSDSVISIYSIAEYIPVSLPIIYLDFCDCLEKGYYIDSTSLKLYSINLTLNNYESLYFPGLSRNLHKSDKIKDSQCKSVSFSENYDFPGYNVFIDRWQSLIAKKYGSRFKCTFDLMRPDSTLYKNYSLYYYKKIKNNAPYFEASEPFESKLDYSLKLYKLSNFYDGDSSLFSKYKIELKFDQINPKAFNDSLSQIFIDSLAIIYLSLNDTVFQVVKSDYHQNGESIFSYSDLLIPEVEDIIRIDFDIRVLNRKTGFKYYGERISQPILIIPPDHN